MNQMETAIQVIEEKAKKYSVNGLHTDQIMQDINSFKVKIVLVGAFSAGKSALLNTFLSRDILAEDQRPETAIASELVYDSREYVEAITVSGVQRCTLAEMDRFDGAGIQYLKWHLNALALREIAEYILVDMPGFNSGIQAHNKAILQYADQANAYLLIIDADDGGIKQSVSAFINEIRNYENNMAIVITKSDLKTEKDLALVKEAVADVANELFDYEVPVIVTSKFDENAQIKLRNLILQFDRESIFRQTFLPQVAEAGERILQVLAVLKKNSSLNTSDLEEEIRSREQAKMKLAEKLQNERIRLSNKLQNQVQPAILADAENALRQQADALASSLASGGSNFSMLVNNILRPVLVSSTQAYVENSFDEFVSSIPLDMSGQGTNLNEIITRYQEVNENLKNLPETVDKFNGVYKAITIALAVTTTVVAPWLELVLIFLPDVIKLISPMFQQRQDDKILTEVHNRIIPGIIQKLGPEINCSLKELEGEMIGQLEEKMRDMIEMETSALENARARLMEQQEDYGKKMESIDRDMADIQTALNAI